MTRLFGFVACLFDAHALRHDFMRDWMVCERCGEVRITRGEFDSLVRTGRVPR